MARDSKEQVTEQRLRKIRKAQKKLMSPLPAKLKQLEETAVIQLLGEKMRQVPEFVDFDPLEDMDWKQLADVENSQQAETLTPDEARFGETIRKKNRDRKKPAPLSEQSEAATAGSQKTHMSRDDKKLPPAYKSIQTAIADKEWADKKRADKQTEVAGELKPDAKPAASKLKPRPKPNQISAQQKPHRPIRSTPRTLAVLLDKIATLAQSLDPSIPAAAGTRPGNQDAGIRSAIKDKALIADAAARPTPSDAKAKHSRFSKKQKLKVDSLINKSKWAGKPEKSASPMLKKSSKKKPATAPRQDDSAGLGLLSGLIDSLWRQQAGSHAAVSRSRSADTAALSTPPTDASSPVLSTRSAVAAALASPEKAALPAATTFSADKAPGSTPSLNQAEELAEQINRVIREQAWLRGVNLP